jgi:hypothetical protein
LERRRIRNWSTEKFSIPVAWERKKTKNKKHKTSKRKQTK